MPYNNTPQLRDLNSPAHIDYLLQPEISFDVPDKNGNCVVYQHGHPVGTVTSEVADNVEDMYSAKEKTGV